MSKLRNSPLDLKAVIKSFATWSQVSNLYLCIYLYFNQNVSHHVGNSFGTSVPFFLICASFVNAYTLFFRCFFLSADGVFVSVFTTIWFHRPFVVRLPKYLSWLNAYHQASESNCLVTSILFSLFFCFAAEVTFCNFFSIEQYINGCSPDRSNLPMFEVNAENEVLNTLVKTLTFLESGPSDECIRPSITIANFQIIND